MQSATREQMFYITPPGIIGNVISVFPDAELEILCDCDGQSFIPIQRLSEAERAMSVGQVIEKIHCPTCGCAPASVCLRQRMLFTEIEHDRKR